MRTDGNPPPPRTHPDWHLSGQAGGILPCIKCKADRSTDDNFSNGLCCRCTTDGNTMVDWRELLMKYIHIVGQNEGVSFINRDEAEPPLTPEEWAALVQCDIESNDRYDEYQKAP